MNDISGVRPQPRPAPASSGPSAPGSPSAKPAGGYSVKRAKRPRSRMRRIFGHPMLIIQLLVLLVIAGLIAGLIWSRRGHDVPRQAIKPVVPTSTSAPTPAVP